MSASGVGFRTTRWSVVLAAGDAALPQAAMALETLCRTYWYPLYAHLRRAGRSHEDAQDLTQAFFVSLLDHHGLRQVHPAKGKFRSFLLASLKHFLANEWDKVQAMKRGGQFTFVPLDDEVVRERFRREPADLGTPDRAFEQSWATTLLESVLGQLQQAYVAEGRGDLFEALQVYLSGDRSGPSYAEIGARFHLGESGVKMAVLRLRRRFGELLRAEIAHTVSQPEEIDDEIRCLFAAVSA
jgi:DNA-directed RNA polymerase specialized sigma24 family protein